jgi:transcription factor CP2-like protein
VFCDKGAERKTRDEDRRQLKRKQNHGGRRKLEDLYHPKLEKTDFYQMADLISTPVLFNPSQHNAYMVTRVSRGGEDRMGC